MRTHRNREAGGLSVSASRSALGIRPRNPGTVKEYQNEDLYASVPVKPSVDGGALPVTFEALMSLL